jgi:hypothetical protein
MFEEFQQGRNGLLTAGGAASMPERDLADVLHVAGHRESCTWIQALDLGRNLRKDVDVKDNNRWCSSGAVDR